MPIFNTEYKSFKQGRLPAEYQQVEYIESSWTQYIDSLYNPIYWTKIACKFMHNEHSLDTPVFWRRQSWWNYEYTLRSHPSEKVSQWAVRYNIMSANWISVNSYPQWTIIEFEYDKNSYKYWSQTWSISPSTSNITGINLIIFWLREWSSIDSRKFSGRMYYFTIWEYWTLVRDFVPCYRKSDSVIWMYDLVNKVFYTNSWTWTFTKWADVN